MLQIECESADAEYKTVRASKTQKPAQKKKPNAKENYTPKNKSLKFDREVPAPNTSFGGKVLGGVKDWMSKPMKNPRDW
jgi:hypothetical protein